MTGVSTYEIIKILNENSSAKHDAYETFVGLRKRYSEPWRHHHNFEHPREMFGELLYHKHLAKDLGTIAWAIMYHDAVYDPEATPGRNEELSARLAEANLPRLAGSETARKVAAYTRETFTHSDSTDDSDFDLFMDIDLAVLGANPRRYEKYARDIRLEYAHIPDEHYRLGRTAILTSLLNRAEGSKLFKTPDFYELYEDQARLNIASELESL